jgi:2-methylcitrate dehydratase
MSAFSRNLCSTASRTLRQRASIGCKAARPIALAATRTSPLLQRAAVAAPFSTSSTFRSMAPTTPSNREFDPEIKDIASYVHNVPITSDLAV